MKFYTNGLGHMTNMAAMPIYGNNLKNLLLQNQYANDLETWYVALSMWVYQDCSKFDSGLTLTYFMPRSNLVT